MPAQVAHVLVTKADFVFGVLNGVALARLLRDNREVIKTIFLASPENARKRKATGRAFPYHLGPQHWPTR
jgi:hypothetical protein